jgi:hypothetical protein
LNPKELKLIIIESPKKEIKEKIPNSTKKSILKTESFVFVS